MMRRLMIWAGSLVAVATAGLAVWHLAIVPAVPTLAETPECATCSLHHQDRLRLRDHLAGPATATR